MKKEQKLKMQANVKAIPKIDLNEHLKTKRRGLLWWIKLITWLLTAFINILTQEDDE